MRWPMMVKGVVDARAKMIGSATAPEQDAAIYRARKVVNGVPGGAHTLVPLPANLPPLRVRNGVRQHNQGVDWYGGAVQGGELREVRLACKHHGLSVHSAIRGRKAWPGAFNHARNRCLFIYCAAEALY